MHGIEITRLGAGILGLTIIAGCGGSGGSDPVLGSSSSVPLAAQEVLDTYVETNVALGFVLDADRNFTGRLDFEEVVDLPTTGTASYTGASRLDIDELNTTLISRAQLEADFAAATINGTLSEFYNVYFRDWTINEATAVQGSLSVVNGTFFTGPNGEAFIDADLRGTVTEGAITAVFDGDLDGGFFEGGAQDGVRAEVDGFAAVTGVENTTGTVNSAFDGYIQATRD